MNVKVRCADRPTGRNDRRSTTPVMAMEGRGGNGPREYTPNLHRCSDNLVPTCGEFVRLLLRSLGLFCLFEIFNVRDVCSLAWFDVYSGLPLPMF